MGDSEAPGRAVEAVLRTGTKGVPMNAFQIPAKSIFAVEPKRSYPQLDYYHRKMALGIHPRQLRKAKQLTNEQRQGMGK